VGNPEVQIEFDRDRLGQFGLDVNAVIQPDPLLIMEMEQKSYNVFHVAEAEGSPYVPAQADFVVPFRVRSVVGFGGMLPSGDLFAVIAFVRVPMARETGDLFKTLALGIKVAVLPFSNGPVFA